MSDGGPACCTYGAEIVSTNKCQVYNILFDITNKTIYGANDSNVGAYIIAIGH